MLGERYPPALTRKVVSRRYRRKGKMAARPDAPDILFPAAVYSVRDVVECVAQDRVFAHFMSDCLAQHLDFFRDPCRPRGIY
jgi:hypothetical protein